MFFYIVKLLILLPLIGLLAWGSLKLAQKMQTRLGGAGEGGKAVKVIETTMLSPTLKLAVLEFHGREILVSVSRQGLSRLAEAPARGLAGRLAREAAVRHLGLILVLLPATAYAQAAAPGAGSAVSGALDRAFSNMGGNQGTGLSLSLQLLLIMGLLTILPGLLLMMTSFTRILVVLSILRHALGLQQSPPNQVLIGLSLFLSLFVMAPTLETINQRAITPYAAGTMNAEQAIAAAGEEMHGFMIRQTRKHDLAMFAQMANAPKFAASKDVPFSILLPAFATSELKTAFQIGFMLFLPFLVIDLVVSSVLMSLGMMMMSPTIVSLPFKLLLFVLVDGWALLMGSLASSFG